MPTKPSNPAGQALYSCTSHNTPERYALHSRPLVTEEEAPLGEGEGLTRVAGQDAAGGNADRRSPVLDPRQPRLRGAERRRGRQWVQAPGLPAALLRGARPLRLLPGSADPTRGETRARPGSPAAQVARPAPGPHLPQRPRRSQLRWFLAPEVRAELAGKRHSARAALSTRNYIPQKAVAQ